MGKWLKQQYSNAFLWVPFLLAGGAAIYFTCSNTVCITTVILMLFVIMLGALRHDRHLVYGASLVIFGMAYACGFTHIIATPRITHPIRNLDISGRVTGIDYTTDKTRLFLSIPTEQIKSTAKGHATIRVNISDGAPVSIGDTISARVNIFPPSVAYAPETFDYSRWAYFNGLTATGYATEYAIQSHGRGGYIQSLRDKLHHDANSFLADGLALGYKSILSDQDRNIWTTIGIGHVWSISGFHMTLVAGWLFAIFYCILRLIPYITRRVPARIPAMICAWMGLMMYLLLSGMGVATIRAFLMTSLIFIAFIMGRNAISMRNICIAFCIIFFINPHYVMQPGFQLSFSAIFGLIWFWNGRRCYKTTKIGKLSYAIYAAAMTSVVATIFTAPFVAAHFYSMPVYSLVGNLVLMPVFSFAIMPAVIIGTVLAPFGIHWPLDAAEQIYSYALHVAQAIANMPYANIVMPHVPNVAMAIIVLGFLCLMFIRRIESERNPILRNMNYISGTLFILAGTAITVFSPRPLFYASPDHELVAFSYDNKLQFNKARAGGHIFAFDTWKQINREHTGTPNIRRKGENGIWIYKSPRWTLAYVQKFIPLSREIASLCADDKIDYIVSYFHIDAPKCNHKILRGGVVIYPSGRVRHNAVPRPWNNPHQ